MSRYEAGTPPGTVYVLLPVHNRRPVTEQFVRGLLAQTDRDFHLVLIDDGSTDGTAEGVTSLLPSTTVLRGSGSWWWAGSLRQGSLWLAKRGVTARDIVLIANDDTQFDPDFLSLGRASLGREDRRLLLAQLYDRETGSLVEVGVRVRWNPLRFQGVTDPDRVNCMSTRGLFLAARDFLALDSFHVWLLPHYLSDYAFTVRAVRLGYRLRSDPAVRLWYDRSTTGIRSPAAHSMRAYLRSTLTRRSTDNPVYLTTFLLLVCPRRRLAGNVWRVWRRFGLNLLAARRRGRDSPA